MKQLYFVEIDPPSANDLTWPMLAAMPPLKRERLMRLRFEMDRKISVYADALVRCLVCRETGADYSHIRLGIGKYGKPYLINDERFHYNVSHTRSAIIAAVSDRPVGVDIERVRETDDALAARILNAAEHAAYERAGAEKDDRFFSIWTRKEALVKYRGQALPSDLKTLDTMCPPPSRYLTTFAQDNYRVSVCADERFTRGEFTILTENQLAGLWARFAGKITYHTEIACNDVW